MIPHFQRDVGLWTLRCAHVQRGCASWCTDTVLWARIAVSLVVGARVLIAACNRCSMDSARWERIRPCGHGLRFALVVRAGLSAVRQRGDGFFAALHTGAGPAVFTGTRPP